METTGSAVTLIRRPRSRATPVDAAHPRRQLAGEDPLGSDLCLEGRDPGQDIGHLPTRGGDEMQPLLEAEIAARISRGPGWASIRKGRDGSRTRDMRLAVGNERHGRVSA